MNWDYDGDGIWGDVDAPYEQGEGRRAAMERFKEEEKERSLKYKEEDRKKRMKLKARCVPSDQAVGQEGALSAPSARAASEERQSAQRPFRQGRQPETAGLHPEERGDD